jgi:hypothetical protein
VENSRWVMIVKSWLCIRVKFWNNNNNNTTLPRILNIYILTCNIYKIKVLTCILIIKIIILK